MVRNGKTQRHDAQSYPHRWLLNFSTEIHRDRSTQQGCAARFFLVSVKLRHPRNGFLPTTTQRRKQSKAKQIQSEPKRTTMADEWIDVSVAQDGGVKKKVLQAAPEGAAGPPPKGYEVTAHYTGE